MKSRGIVGRRIVAVRQRAFWNEQTKMMDNTVDALVLDDGTELVPHTVETQWGEYGHDFRVERPLRPRGERR